VDNVAACHLVDLWMPEGSSFADTEREAKAVEKRLLQEGPRLPRGLRRRGRAALLLPLDQRLRNQNYAHVFLMSRSLEAREHALVRVRWILAQDFPNVSAGPLGRQHSRTRIGAAARGNAAALGFCVREPRQLW
jgi:multidrug efflux pump subunit AcrB